MNKTKELLNEEIDVQKQIAYLYKYIKENNLDEKVFDFGVNELLKGRPVQYVIGNVNFFGNIISVNEDVLIPRFETELLVEKTIGYLKEYFDDKIDILEIGTGSGCIAISFKKEMDCFITATDISKKALEVASHNALVNNVDIDFTESDIFTKVEKRYDVIISNPPYISEDEEIMDLVKNNEPHLALYAKNDGLYFFEEIIKESSNYLKEKYLMAFEIGSKQAGGIIKIANTYLNDIKVKVEKDYNDRDRFIFISNF